MNGESLSANSSDLSTSLHSVGSNTGDSSSSECQVTSILNVLRVMNPSFLARRCKLTCNPPTGVKHCHVSTTDPKNVTPLDRVKQYLGEQLIGSAGKLFCSACREELSSKKSVIKLCGLKFVAKSLLGKEVARLLVEYISKELGISSPLIIGAMHDRAAVDGVAMSTLSVFCN